MKFSAVVLFSRLNLLTFSETSRSTSVWTGEPVSPQHKWLAVISVDYPSVDNGNVKMFDLFTFTIV